MMQLFAREWSLRNIGGDVDDCNARVKPHKYLQIISQHGLSLRLVRAQPTCLDRCCRTASCFPRATPWHHFPSQKHKHAIRRYLPSSNYLHSFRSSFPSLNLQLVASPVPLSLLLHCITAIVHSTLFAMKVTHVASLFASGLGAIAVSSGGAINPSKLPPYSVSSAAYATQSRHSLMASLRILSEPMFSPPPLSIRPLTSSSRSVPRTPPAVPQMP